MTYLLIALHVIVCIALIIIVLLQMGKGAEVGASFGAGASQTIFGASGSANFMSRLTAGAAVIFMLTSMALAYYYSSPGAGSVMPSSVSVPSKDVSSPVTQAPPTETPAPTPQPEKK